ncbi:hypothetical protein QV65_09650 [Rhodococcus erythropolis]|nr:hypothetical protein QV65_09650 [Rhodococcus erythropolis]
MATESSSSVHGTGTERTAIAEVGNLSRIRWAASEFSFDARSSAVQGIPGSCPTIRSVLTWSDVVRAAAMTSAGEPP